MGVYNMTTSCIYKITLFYLVLSQHRCQRLHLIEERIIPKCLLFTDHWTVIKDDRSLLAPCSDVSVNAIVAS
jgi:hypothetical protein